MQNIAQGEPGSVIQASVSVDPNLPTVTSAVKSAGSVSDLEQLTVLFRLLSDSTRLNILMMLGAGERNVTSLCEALSLPQPTVSHHLGLLRMNSVIGNRRQGKQVFYTLDGRVDATDRTAIRINAGAYSVTIATGSQS